MRRKVRHLIHLLPYEEKRFLSFLLKKVSQNLEKSMRKMMIKINGLPCEQTGYFEIQTLTTVKGIFISSKKISVPVILIFFDKELK